MIRYQGEKSRISQQISDVIVSMRWGGYETLVSLFCGTCSVESKLAPYFKSVICNDNHEYLIELLNGVKNGYDLPEHISEERYKYIRDHKDENKIETGFVGFGCSFGGKWFGGYARNKTNTNYAAQSKKSLLKDMETLMNARFMCGDYRDIELPQGCVIYADPPYENTTGYGGVKFNSSEFWDYAKQVSEDHLMFISEQNAPDDFEAIWQKPFTRTLDANKNNQFKVTEKLFVHKKYA